jgi:putative heme-binding domain-containing protein
VAKLPASGIARLDDAGMKNVRGVLADLLREAVKTAPDDERPVEDRVAAIRMLELAPFRDVEEFFPGLLHFRQPQSVQAAAVDTLIHFDQPGVPAMLIDAWPGFSPQSRAGAVEAFLSRSNWIDAFLDAVEQGRIHRGDVDVTRMQSLQSHGEERLKARAANLFAGAKLERRADVVTAYQESLRLEGDRARGKALFQQECSACHQLEGVGTMIGADLTAVRGQGAEKILLSILDPNRDVKPQFNTYVLLTDEGRAITGLITSETANSLTIRRADGTSETVLRIHIELLKSTGMSFMPEGMEKRIDVRGMADLLAYLASIQ